MRCHGRDQDQVVLVEGPRKRLHHLCFGASPAGLAAAKARVEKAGIRLLDPPNEAPGDGLWFRDPDGALVNIRAAQPAPWRDGRELVFNYPNRFYRVATPGHPSRHQPVQPRRLSHVLLFTPDVMRQVDFYERIVGLRLSDRAQNVVAFMRSGEGDSDHHILAFALSERPGFHHASFEVAT